MVKRSRGFFSKSTRMLRRKKSLTVNDQLKTFEVGDRVVIKIQPFISGIPHPRYNNRVGKIVEKRGECYVVEIKDGRSIKQLITHPIHLEKTD